MGEIVLVEEFDAVSSNESVFVLAAVSVTVRERVFDTVFVTV